jgi:hypothetical protein
MLRDRPLNLNLLKILSKLLLKLSQLLITLLEKPSKKNLAVAAPRRAQAKRSVELVQAALADREVLILAVKEMRVKLPMI